MSLLNSPAAYERSSDFRFGPIVDVGIEVSGRSVQSVSTREIDNFAKSLRLNRYAPRTIRQYVGTIRTLEDWMRSHGRVLRDLTEDALLDFAETLPFTYASQMRLVNSVKAYWRVHLGRPARTCPARCVRVPSKPPMIYRGLDTPAEARAIVIAARKQGTAPHVAAALAYYAGARCAEIAELERAGDLGGHLRIVGKGAQTGIIPMHAYLRAALDEHYETSRDERWVLPGRFKGTHVSTMTVGQWIAKASWCALGRHVTPHQLRYTFGGTVLDETDNLRTANVLLRHSKSSINVTAGYTRTTAIAMRQGIETL